MFQSPTKNRRIRKRRRRPESSPTQADQSTNPHKRQQQAVPKNKLVDTAATASAEASPSPSLKTAPTQAEQPAFPPIDEIPPAQPSFPLFLPSQATLTSSENTTPASLNNVANALGTQSQDSKKTNSAEPPSTVDTAQAAQHAVLFPSLTQHGSFPFPVSGNTVGDSLGGISNIATAPDSCKETVGDSLGNISNIATGPTSGEDEKNQPSNSRKTPAFSS